MICVLPDLSIRQVENQSRFQLHLFTSVHWSLRWLWVLRPDIHDWFHASSWQRSSSINLRWADVDITPATSLSPKSVHSQPFVTSHWLDIGLESTKKLIPYYESIPLHRCSRSWDAVCIQSVHSEDVLGALTRVPAEVCWLRNSDHFDE